MGIAKFPVGTPLYTVPEMTSPSWKHYFIYRASNGHIHRLNTTEYSASNSQLYRGNTTV